MYARILSCNLYAYIVAGCNKDMKPQYEAEFISIFMFETLFQIVLLKLFFSFKQVYVICNKVLSNIYLISLPKITELKRDSSIPVPKGAYTPK